MTDQLPANQERLERVLAFREKMHAADQSIPATIEQLRMAARLIHGQEALFRLYGLGIEELVARNFSISPRTMMECMIDIHVECLLRCVADIVSTEALGVNSSHPAVYDLFCGSGNISYHLGRHLNWPVFASDLDPHVHNATRHNLELLGATVNSGAGFSFTLRLADYRSLLAARPLKHHPSDLYIIEPPWGSGIMRDGLDLTRTRPPVQDIMTEIGHQRAGVPCYVALKALRSIVHNSLEVAMAGATPIQVIQCSPVYIHGVDFHIYRL
ncbi:hypothetical protein BGZ63DRAFT_391998 [Mariannaea sp. PMI_226]|nr:hypothetical protein BGZ63DRAFT_391998 [Mariannaea sp. PMI_226]